MFLVGLVCYRLKETWTCFPSRGFMPADQQDPTKYTPKGSRVNLNLSGQASPRVLALLSRALHVSQSFLSFFFTRVESLLFSR